MTTETREIRARIQCINGSDEIKKFVPVDELPTPGAKIQNTKYSYGKSRPAVLSKIQRTRDDELQIGHDFYIVNAIDDTGATVGELYFCTPHKKSNKPSRKMFNIFIGQAVKYDDIEQYVVDMMNSKLWEDEDITNDGRENWLKTLYKGAHMTVEDLIKEYGMTQMQFCNHFGIPKRTVENWVYLRQPPLYLLTLFEEVLGAISCE